MRTSGLSGTRYGSSLIPRPFKELDGASRREVSVAPVLTPRGGTVMLGNADDLRSLSDKYSWWKKSTAISYLGVLGAAAASRLADAPAMAFEFESVRLSWPRPLPLDISTSPALFLFLLYLMLRCC